MSSIALVTGGNQGIGYEVVRNLVQKGFIVYLGARSADKGQEAVTKLHKEGLTKVKFLQLDVTSDESVAKAAQQFQSEQSHLDVLINNAGVAFHDKTPAYDVTIETMKQTYEVNVFGVVRVTGAFISFIKKSKQPIILNVSSLLGSGTLQSDPSQPFSFVQLAAYNSSKSALNQYTITVARAFPEAKVNAIHPGHVSTNINNYTGAITTEDSAEGVVKYGVLFGDYNNAPTCSFLSYDGSVLPW